MGTASFAAIVAVVFLAQDLSRAGADAMRAGRYAEAERIFRQLAKRQPGEAGWHGNLGLALYSQQKYRESAAALERSLKLRPAVGLYAVLGIDYLKLGDACKAIAPLEKGDRREALADAYLGCKRYAEAARVFEKLGNLREAARTYWQARDYEAAGRLFRLVATDFVTDPAFNFEYGDSLLRASGAAAALPYLEKAASLVEARAALGKAYVELGRFADAIPHLEAGVKADPDLWLPLSRSYKETGRAAEADRALLEYKKRSTQN